jgi:hypothetical protein
MSGYVDYAELFRVEVERRLRECRALWATYAAQRGLQTKVGADGAPILEGHLDGAAVSLLSSGSAVHGFRTRARIEVRLAESGSVRVSPPSAVEELVGYVFHRGFFGDARLDAKLVVHSTPDDLARAVLDEKVVEVLRLVVERPLFELAYGAGALTWSWAGVEHDVPTLDATLDLLAHLALRGVARAPYR